MAIIPLLQLMACTTLAVVSIQWRIAHSTSESAYRHLLPFIVVAGVLGIILISPLAELFVAYYRGSIFEMEAVTCRYKGPYWWAYWSLAIFPLLPMLGLLPFIGKRPVLMASLAGLATLPVIYGTIAK